MKRVLFTVLSMSLLAGFVMAQSIINGYRARGFGQPPTYNPVTPPPLPLAQAYALALRGIGRNTNQFHCVSGNCTEMTNNGLTGWKFIFANTNGDFADVEVYFDKVVTSDFARNRPATRRTLHHH